MMIQHSDGKKNNIFHGKRSLVAPPTILGQSTPIAEVQLPEQSSIIYVYQDPQSHETAYHPVQAHQHCNR